MADDLADMTVPELLNVKRDLQQRASNLEARVNLLRKKKAEILASLKELGVDNLSGDALKARAIKELAECRATITKVEATAELIEKTLNNIGR